ncbi:NAD(P)/FAD-dependent oxidoreductase [Micavibrio aeruginosavorus]|uniref:Aminobutyraldehyde dehydrogenase n=1 Tax=Micavibrio aeruginosavorus EPB TaxID=349215 RepID=M4VIB3_9BACT|nr:NAD(P)/FAD-dependent oxidoreductase [Micavibrio aeruginosavorus]AGH97786.1 Aminobutyraldehyde dehydrogenase [Micavibrio aeruginosavorus EPB]
MEKIDVLIIGAGVVGLAAGRALSLAGREVIVAESEAMIGSVTSARNSGVIHAGIYYPTGSNKARLCVRGKDLLYTYARDRHVPYKNCGKMIVACIPEDFAKIETICDRAKANGVHDLTPVTRDEALAMEPELDCLGGVLSPSTGIIDIHILMQEFQADIENNGGFVALRNGITGGHVTAAGIIIELQDAEPILAKTVINAAGLSAQSVARMIVGLDQNTIPPRYVAKGNYFSVSGAAPFSRLVYPVPVPGGLGAHFTMNIAGESQFGPDVEWLDTDANHFNYTVDPSREPNFRESVRRYWPGVMDRELIPSYAGIRPKLAGPGQPDGDFVIQGPDVHGVAGLINLYGIESPGLTSCMAIAEDVAKLLNQ